MTAGHGVEDLSIACFASANTLVGGSATVVWIARARVRVFFANLSASIGFVQIRVRFDPRNAFTPGVFASVCVPNRVGASGTPTLIFGISGALGWIARPAN